MQQVHILHLYPGLISSVAVDISALLQEKLTEIIEKGGHRIIAAIPCGGRDGCFDYVVVTERDTDPR